MEYINPLINILRTFSVLIFALCIAGYANAVQVLNDVAIANEKYKNILSIFNGTDIRTFPYDEAYGADTYWSRWDVLLNEDNTYSFRLNNKYISANVDDSVGFVSTLSETEKFHLEAGNGSYYFKTWRGSYLSTTGSGWVAPTQSWEKTSEEEWLFFDVVDPSGETLNDLNVSNFYYKTILSIFNGSDARTFPYDEAYGANTFWSKWDIILNDDGTHSIRVGNNYYLSAHSEYGVDIVRNETHDTRFTLQAGNQGTFYILSADGYYLQASGSGWVALELADTQAKQNQWYFFDRQDVEVFSFSSSQVIDYDLVSNVDENIDTVGFIESFSNPPAVFANMQTFSGTDTSDLRINNVDTSGFDVFVQEEQSKDSEVDHNNETIGFIALDEGVIFDQDGKAIGEVGSVEFAQDDANRWFTINNFIASYTNPIVIMVTNTVNGSHASHIRLKNVTASSFQYQLEEWDYLDGTHATETAAYLIVEAGAHTLQDGTLFQATTQSIDHNAQTVNLPSTHTETPIVLSQTQTVNGNASVNTRQHSVTTSTVKIRLQEQEADNGTHNDEIVGVVTIGK